MRILFASVIYEGVKNYLDDFLQSIYNQTYKNFDILLINDGLDDDQYINRITSNQFCINIIKNFNKNYNPSELRLQILKYAIDKKYDLLIFGDSDDTFSINRIEEIKNKYSNEFAFYYNDLIVMDSNKDFFKGKLPSNVNDKRALDNYNFIGMSNSSVNINLIKCIVNEMQDLKDCIAFDWLFYTLILKKGFKGVKVENVQTYYRIHCNNIAGFTNEIEYNKLINGIEIKKYQYKTLSYIDNSFIQKYKDTKLLEEKILHIEGYAKKYINLINSKYKDSVFWWENIKL